MSVTQAITSVATTATLIADCSDGRLRGFLLQNVDASKTIYVGTSAVTTAAYGFTLAPGEKVSVQLDSHDVLYACVASGTANIAVLGAGNRSS